MMLHLETLKLENIEMGYTIKTSNQGLGYLGITQDILGISPYAQPGSFPPHRAFWAAALCFLLVSIAWPRLAPSCSTAIRRSSVSVTDRPLRRGFPCHRHGFCHSHGFTSYMLLPLLPDSLAVSTRPYGNRLR